MPARKPVAKRALSAACGATRRRGSVRQLEVCAADQRASGAGLKRAGRARNRAKERGADLGATQEEVGMNPAPAVAGALTAEVEQVPPYWQDRSVHARYLGETWRSVGRGKKRIWVSSSTGGGWGRSRP